MVRILTIPGTRCYTEGTVSKAEASAEVGESPLFFRPDTENQAAQMERTAQLQQRVETMLRDALPEVEVLLAEQISPGMLRVTIYRPGGVDVALCERVTRELSALRETYALEVSSPGIERPLVKPEHFRRVIGEPVAVKTERPIEGRRSFKGVLTDASDEKIELDQDGQPISIPLAAVRRSNLVVEQLGGTR